MSRSLARRITGVLAAVVLGTVGQLTVSGAANAAVSVTTATLKDGQLRIEGSGGTGGTFIAAFSTTDVAGARVGTDGRFKIETSGFTAPDCYVTINAEYSPLTTVHLGNCTRSVTPVPSQPAPPTGSCVITSQGPASLSIGTGAAVYFLTTGCDTGTGTTPDPVIWSVVAGVIPTGMTGPNLQGSTAANIIGTPSIAGTYQFTLQATDQAGATDQENITIVVS